MRNSGTEDKSALYLRGPHIATEPLSQLGFRLHLELLKGLKDPEKDLAKLERALLLAIHQGQDFAAPLNTPIYATAPGVVAYAGVRSGYGNTVELDHGRGFKTRYAHLQTISVRVGQRVGVGTRIEKPSSLPFNSGRTRPSALAAPVEVGIWERAAARPR